MNLTPEQMNEAVEAANAALTASVEEHLAWNVNAYGKAWTGEGEDTDFICSGAAEAALSAALPVLFAAWQEQTAAKAGENPHASDTVCWCPDDWREPFDKTRCPQHGGAAYESVRAKAYREGAAAGVAASEARAVERFDRAFAEYASRHAGPFPGELVAHLRAALLSEEAS